MRYFIAVYKNTEVGLTDVNHNIIIMKLQKKDSLRAFTSSTNVVVYIFFTSAALFYPQWFVSETFTENEFGTCFDLFGVKGREGPQVLCSRPRFHCLLCEWA